MTEFLPTHKFKLDIKSHNALPFFLSFFFSFFSSSIFSTRFSLSSTTFCRDMFATVPVTTCSLSHHLLTACLVLRRRPRLLIFYTGKQRNRVGSGVEKRRSMRHRNFTPTQDAVIRGDNSRFSPLLALSLSLSLSVSLFLIGAFYWIHPVVITWNYRGGRGSWLIDIARRGRFALQELWKAGAATRNGTLQIWRFLYSPIYCSVEKLRRRGSIPWNPVESFSRKEDRWMEPLNEAKHRGRHFYYMIDVMPVWN